MSKKTNGVNYGKSPTHKMRRVNALKRLEDQLVRGTKFSRDENGNHVVLELTDKDFVRIAKEIETLKSRIWNL